ncbi:hypothetical protein H5410_008820, partial [Solanum commersonii]
MNGNPEKVDFSEKWEGFVMGNQVKFQKNCRRNMDNVDARRIAWKLASFGYGVIAMDYPGFELSVGLHGYILSFDKLVDDVIEHYSKVKEKPKFCNLPSFLFGESMGGAIALKVHQKQPDAWNGTVLVASLCKVYLWKCFSILTDASDFDRRRKVSSQQRSYIVRTQDLGESAVRDAKKKEY